MKQPIYRPEKTKLLMLLGMCKYWKNILYGSFYFIFFSLFFFLYGLIWLICLDQCEDLLMSILIVRIFPPYTLTWKEQFARRLNLLCLQHSIQCLRKRCLPKVYAL